MFASDWSTLYPSSITRQKRRERLRSFLRYCYEAQWLERVTRRDSLQGRRAGDTALDR